MNKFKRYFFVGWEKRSRMGEEARFDYAVFIPASSAKEAEEKYRADDESIDDSIEFIHFMEYEKLGSPKSLPVSYFKTEP